MTHTQRPLIRPMKSGNIIERSHAYRERAETLRAIADEALDEDCRVTLLRLAQSYDRLAVHDGIGREAPAPQARQNPWPLKFRAPGAVPSPR